LSDLALTFVGTHGRSAPAALRKECEMRADKVAASGGARHFRFHMDDAGQPLMALGKIVGLEITRDAGRRGSSYFIHSLSLWSQHDNRHMYFPCHEWLEDDGQPFTPMQQCLHKTLWPHDLHSAAPPLAPKAPHVEFKDVFPDEASKSVLPLPSLQLICITFKGEDLSFGMRWRLQCVPEGSRPGPDTLLDEEVHAPKFEVPVDSLVIGKLRLLPGRSYLWRVAAIHPVFGAGPFSATTSVAIEESEVSAGRTKLVISKLSEIAARRANKVHSPLTTALRHAVAIQPLPERNSSAIGEVAKGVHARCLDPISFEDAYQPLKDGGGDGLLVCVGDAEIWKGSLDLTPLRKGMGLAGAAWFHRPLALANGFETEFEFRIKPPPMAYLDPVHNEWLYPRASDGFAFVLHLDGRRAHALGSAGIQLGFGGMSNCLSVQFCSTPSCSPRRKRARAGEVDDDENDDQTLCTLPEPHDHIFFVPNAYSGKECICPFTGIQFIAPQLARNPLGDENPYGDSDFADLTHRIDRISVQCAGIGTSTSGPESCVAMASLRMLDDGERHKARIVLERNRFIDSPAALSDEEAPTPLSHRLLVFVDDMQEACINLEIDLNAIFSQLPSWNGRLFAGFTAGTGKTYGSHAIESWNLWESLDNNVPSTSGAGQENSWWSSMLGNSAK